MTVVEVVSYMVSVSDNELVGYPEIQKLTGLPIQTARRYATTFGRWIPSRTVGRATKFSKETIPIFERIREAFEAGGTTIEVKDMLAADTHPILDVEPSPPSQPAQAPDLQSPPPALPEVMAAIVPLAERFLVAYEAQTKALQDIAAALAHNRPFGGFGHSGDVKGHGDVPEGQDKPHEGAEMMAVDRQGVIARVMELHGQGLGQHAITTRVRREGLRMSARGQLSKSTVARIIKGEII